VSKPAIRHEIWILAIYVAMSEHAYLENNFFTNTDGDMLIVVPGNWAARWTFIPKWVA
jgi:hypothetical protein